MIVGSNLATVAEPKMLWERSNMGRSHVCGQSRGKRYPDNNGRQCTYSRFPETLERLGITHVVPHRGIGNRTPERRLLGLGICRKKTSS